MAQLMCSPKISRASGPGSPGKPADNVMVEAFNAMFRAEFLDERRLLYLKDARE